MLLRVPNFQTRRLGGFCSGRLEQLRWQRSSPSMDVPGPRAPFFWERPWPWPSERGTKARGGCCGPRAFLRALPRRSRPRRPPPPRAASHQPRCRRRARGPSGCGWRCPGAGGRCASRAAADPAWGWRWPCCCCCCPPAAPCGRRTTRSPSCWRASAWWCATPARRRTAPSPPPWASPCAPAAPRWPSPPRGAPTTSRPRWATAPWPSISTRY